MTKEIIFVKPKEIEKKSFSMITEELKQRGIEIPKEQEKITKRAIHTTADFEYASTLYYSENAVSVAMELLKNGADIVTDTNMALAGINKKVLASFGGEAHCFMADKEVTEEAKRRGVTRAAVSMERALAISKPVVFAIGNAPTALLSLHEEMNAGHRAPDFVIGVPVGFVNVEAAKELFVESAVPCIINRGRKGGSNVAAAICNALLYQLQEIEAERE